MASESVKLQGRPMVAGEAQGAAVVLGQGLSFAMGFDVIEGRVSDAHSPARGVRLARRILVMPVGRGSSSASTSLAEAIRLGTAPSAIILREVDEILAVAAMVARTLYGIICPIVVLAPSDYDRIADGDELRIDVNGVVATADSGRVT